MIENAESIIKWAMEIADDLPEEYQVAAFAELLRHGLRSASRSAEPDAGAQPGALESPPARRSLQETLVSGLPDDFLVKTKGSRDQQTVWAVIKLWLSGDEATSNSVRDTIEAALAVRPQTPRNTRKRLRKLTPQYLKRKDKERGRGYAYTPTPEALEVFKPLREGAEE